MTADDRLAAIRARLNNNALTVADVIYLMAEAGRAPHHDHLTRDVRPIGMCPGCDTRPRLLAEVARLRERIVQDAPEPTWEED